MKESKGPAKAGKKTESEWINTVLKKGTIADRLAAHTLLIHESKNWSSLSTLIDMVDPKKCRRQCMMALTTLKELFLDSLNVSKTSNMLKSDDDKQKAKFYFTRFVDQLSLVAFDTLEETRKKSIWVLSELLSKYHDNKEYILEKLIDKLGDKSSKLASTAGHLVEKTVNSQKPEFRIRAIKCVQRFMKRPKTSPSAKFYCVSLLSRMRLVKGEHDMANELMHAYIDLYATLCNQKNFDSKLMNALLVGIHRAFPYTKLSSEVFEQHLHNLYTLVHKVNFRMSLVAMVLIKDIVTKRSQLLKTPIEDRFYNLVFGQLIRPDLQTSSRQQAFVDLLLNVINEDTVLERREAFVKRMLQVALSSRPYLAQMLLNAITQLKGLNISLGAIARDENQNDEDSSCEEEIESTSWLHRSKKQGSGYDPLGRNPRSANAGQLNELYMLRQYYDPELAKLARTIIHTHSAESDNGTT